MSVCIWILISILIVIFVIWLFSRGGGSGPVASDIGDFDFDGDSGD